MPMSRDGGPTTDVSLITGVIRRTGIDDDDDDGDTAADSVTDAVACRQEGTVATSQTTAAGRQSETRHWSSWSSECVAAGGASLPQPSAACVHYVLLGSYYGDIR